MHPRMHGHVSEKNVRPRLDTGALSCTTLLYPSLLAYPCFRLMHVYNLRETNNIDGMPKESGFEEASTILDYARPLHPTLFFNRFFSGLVPYAILSVLEQIQLDFHPHTSEYFTQTRLPHSGSC